MTTGTLTAIEFVLERLAEDEQIARSKRKRRDFYEQPCPKCGRPVLAIGSPFDDDGIEMRALHTRTRAEFGCELTRDQVNILMPDVGPTLEGIRALAEVTAKRRILDRHAQREDRRGCYTCDTVDEPCRVAAAFAAIYAAHPDCRQEWKQ